jgi:glucokinase
MTSLIGIDVGGTKIAAGLLAPSGAEVLARRLRPTGADRGGEAVLADVIDLACSLRDEAMKHNAPALAIGVGVAELTSPRGDVLDEATIRWKGVDVDRRISAATSLPVTIEADVRAAARAEAELGAGRGLRSFLYVTVGTGISACLVLEGSPYTGARGLAGSFASGRTLIAADDGTIVPGPPLERFAGGPAIAARLAESAPEFSGTAREALALAENGDVVAAGVVDSAGRALGAAIAHLVNVLDPHAIVIGGGLGLAGGRYRSSLVTALRSHIYSDHHRDLPLVDAALGVDAGWIGAALAASRAREVSNQR